MYFIGGGGGQYIFTQKYNELLKNFGMGGPKKCHYYCSTSRGLRKIKNKHIVCTTYTEEFIILIDARHVTYLGPHEQEVHEDRTSFFSMSRLGLSGIHRIRANRPDIHFC